MAHRTTLGRPAAAARLASLAAAIVAIAGAANAQEFRTITGENNNLANPTWGKAGSFLLRCSAGAFYGGPTHTWEMGGEGRPNPREVSNIVFSQSDMVFDEGGRSDMVWQWGQFIDHDLALTHATTDDAVHIAVPTGDPIFDPGSQGKSMLPFFRSVSVYEDGMPWREQPGVLTQLVDASMIYGSDDFKALWLRELSGGRLRTTVHAAGVFPPYGDGIVENDPGPAFGPHGGDHTHMFVAGDVRANEQSGLLSMHTLWVREHNRIADLLAAANPSWDDEELYQRARSVVSALVQNITYDEFLPTLLGKDALPPYTGYDPTVNPGLLTEFAASAYRVGHTMLSTEILRLGEDQQPIPQGNLMLRNMFFDPTIVLDNGGIEPILRGLASGNMQKIDTNVIDDVRNMLFGHPSIGGMDLVSLNIQRARDHGLPDYNTVRVAFGLAPKMTFAEITSDPEVQMRLEAAYGDTSNMDLWPGLLAEDHVPGAAVGETLRTILVDQFTRLRDGDRFFYLNPDEPSDLAGTLAALGMTLDDLDATTLGQVIKRNTNIIWLHDYVFRLRLTGDADGNGRVDFLDLNAVLSTFGQNGFGVAGDTNGDGVVDFDDLNNALSGFGASVH
jgi:peroxidase